LGFTLAEVLITLGIIGVVAALTLPTLIANHKKQVYVSQLKAFYSQMSQAVQKMRADTGCSDLNCMGLGYDVDDDEWNENLYNLINSQMNIIKYVKKPVVEDMVGFYNLIQSSHAYGDYTCLSRVTPKDVVFYAKNGVKFEMIMNTDEFITIFVDVNGENKKPNILGRDVFHFIIPIDEVRLFTHYGQFRANGVKNPNHLYWKTGGFCDPKTERNGNGAGCSTRIMESGWKMDY